MADYVLVDGDQAIFQPTFEAAIVTVRPGSLEASAPTTLGGTKLCVDGDESSVSVPGCSYVTGTHSTPGAGTLEIRALAADQTAVKTRSGGKRVLLVGGTFSAAFSVERPAQQPAPPGPPIPDPTSSYSGSGSFVTTNTKFNGT